MTQPHPLPPLTTATKNWYAPGQFAEGLKNESFSLILLFYYTAVLGLSRSLAGLALTLGILMVITVLVSTWRTHHREGS